ncbi:hypothetical protein B0H13DRAFT_2077980 [Mycena leptocephala]|nr:hypothetical protein B0H13DRAFT_2077980 [Mycena leptocephala]
MYHRALWLCARKKWGSYMYALLFFGCLSWTSSIHRAISRMETPRERGRMYLSIYAWLRCSADFLGGRGRGR